MIVQWTSTGSGRHTVQVESVADIDGELESTRVLLAFNRGEGSREPCAPRAEVYLTARVDALLDARLEMARIEAARLRGSWWGPEPRWPGQTSEVVL